jgi:hypothetical protein
MTRNSTTVIFATCGTLAMLLAGNAQAGAKPPVTNVPAIAEYIEPNPTLGGPTEAPPTHGVTPAIAQSIAQKGGADATALTNLAGSVPRAEHTAATVRNRIDSPRGSALGVFDHFSGISYGNAILLGLALVLISLACGAAAARRRGQSPIHQ